MTHRCPARVIVLASLLCPAVASVAGAQESPDGGTAQAVAVIRIDIAGENPPGLAGELDAAVKRGLETLGFSSVSYDRTRPLLEGDPALADCIAPDCLDDLPERIGTNQFLRLRVEASSAIYDFELMFLAAGEGIKERRKGSCPVCTHDEFLERVTENVRTLMEPFRPLPVVVESSPAGAALIIDGREMGVAPVSGRLSPGAHQIRASLDGHMDAERTIDVAPGSSNAPQRFTVALTAAPTVDSGSGRPFRIWKWPTAAAALGALGAGAVWMAVDGDPSCGAPSSVQCPAFYDTGTRGIVSMSAGVALGALAGYMFWSDSGSDGEPAETALTPSLAPTAGGALGAIDLRF